MLIINANFILYITNYYHVTAFFIYSHLRRKTASRSSNKKTLTKKYILLILMSGFLVSCPSLIYGREKIFSNIFINS